MFAVPYVNITHTTLSNFCCPKMDQDLAEAKAAECKKMGAYFDDYSSLDVHKTMLTDKVRTSAYYNAIMSHKDYFKDKVVMDVGCGTGILSLFCAKAGAKKVYAVDASKISTLAEDIVNDNNLGHVIEVLQCPVEMVILPDNIKVDVIVSEWMGFYLLHEGMLDSVIFARDNFLKADGKMFPEHAYLYVAPCSVPSAFDQWDDFYGFNMGQFSKKLIRNGMPNIQTVRVEELIGPEAEIASYNIKTVTNEELDQLTLKKVIPASRDGNYQGLCIWWKCEFPTSRENGSQVVLSTSPHDPTTHWQQCVLVLPLSQEVEENQPIAFELTMNRIKTNMRHYIIEYNMVDPEEIEHPTPCHCYLTKCILVKAFLSQVENIENNASGIEEDDITENDTDTSNGNS